MLIKTWFRRFFTYSTSVLCYWCFDNLTFDLQSGWSKIASTFPQIRQNLNKNLNFLRASLASFELRLPCSVLSLQFVSIQKRNWHANKQEKLPKLIALKECRTRDSDLGKDCSLYRKSRFCLLPSLPGSDSGIILQCWKKACFEKNWFFAKVWVRIWLSEMCLLTPCCRNNKGC